METVNETDYKEKNYALVKRLNGEMDTKKASLGCKVCMKVHFKVQIDNTYADTYGRKTIPL